MYRTRATEKNAEIQVAISSNVSVMRHFLVKKKEKEEGEENKPALAELRG